MAAVDAGASDNYFRLADSTVLTRMQQCNKLDNVTVRMPNGEHIQSYARAEIATNLLPAAARQVHVFKAEDLTEYSLLSVNKLCQNGLEVLLFNADRVLVQEPSTKHICLQEGDRDATTDLYMVRLTAIGHNICNVYPPAYNQKQTVEFAIATMGSPVTSSLLKAVSKKFVEIPGLTTSILRRHPHSKATAIGHLDLTRQGLSNTTLPGSKQPQARSITTQQQDDEDAFPARPILHDNAERKPVFVKTITLDKTYGDTLGSHEWSSIHAHSLHRRCKLHPRGAHANSQGLRVHQSIWPRLGLLQAPRYQAITPSHGQQNLQRPRGLPSQVPIQYVAPDNHRQNKAERIIRVWKKHFISILATTDPDFPLHAWEELLTHAELTINLLRASNTNTSISA